MNSPDIIPTISMGGIKVSRLGYKATLSWIEQRLKSPIFTQVATANMDFLNLCRRHTDLPGILNEQCDLVTADGMPLVWLSWLVGKPIAERVAGSDLLTEVVQLAAKQNLRVYFLGGDERATTPAINVLQTRIPGLNVVGMNCDRFDENNETNMNAIVDDVRASKTDVLFVALGCPKQERFIAKYRDVLGVRFAMGIGGSFDFISGRRLRAPKWMQRTGLEWVCRMAQEPRRLAPRYLANFVCLLRILGGIIGGGTLKPLS